MSYFYCKYCGAKALSVSSLTGNSCSRSHSGRHELYEGAEQSQYICKFCGAKAHSISSLTGNSCRKSPHNRHEPSIQGGGALNSSKANSEHYLVQSKKSGNLKGEKSVGEDNEINNSNRRSSVSGGRLSDSSSNSEIPFGCFGVLFLCVAMISVVGKTWTRYFESPSSKSLSNQEDPKSVNKNVAQSENNQIVSDNKRPTEEKRKAAAEMIAWLCKYEVERLRNEEQFATMKLREDAKLYPSTPELSQRIYDAKQALMLIENEYQLKLTAIRDKYDSIEREQNKHFRTDDELYKEEMERLQKSNSDPKNQNVRNLLPIYKRQDSKSAQQMFYVVEGISPGDLLNVREGPGENHAIIARLPEGSGRLLIVGEPILNGKTEWVRITFGDHAGWVAKAYLKAE